MTPALEALKSQLNGRLIDPDNPQWDEARLAWNLSVDQRPAAVALPESADDVVAVVRDRPRARAAGRAAGDGPRRLGDRLARGRGAAQDPPHGRGGHRRRQRARAGGGGRAVGERHAAGGRARPRGAGGLRGRRRGGRLLAWRRRGLAGAQARAGVQLDRRRGGGHGGRESRDGRPGQRAGPVLGDPRRWRELRGGHEAGARAGAGREPVCGRPVLAAGEGGGDPSRVARLDRPTSPTR